jgi:hypothetical protein
MIIPVPFAPNEVFAINGKKFLVKDYWRPVSWSQSKTKAARITRFPTFISLSKNKEATLNISAPDDLQKILPEYRLHG